MNYQSYGKDIDLASQELGVASDDVDYYAWPQTFGSTSGPFGGIGGQTISCFTIEAYAFAGDAVLFCNGKRLRRVNNFNPLMRV